jgi:hypothetical protein
MNSQDLLIPLCNQGYNDLKWIKQRANKLWSSPNSQFNPIVFSSQTRRHRCTLKTETSVGTIFHRPHRLVRTLSTPSISTREYIWLDMSFCGLKIEDTKKNLPL